LTLSLSGRVRLRPWVVLAANVVGGWCCG